MDQTLILKIQEFKKTLTTLQEALSLEYNKVVRDSIIKRFEYTFELVWKTAKVLLQEKFGVDAASPKDCFRELRNNVTISDDDAVALMEMTDDRNEIIHTHKETVADELYKAIAGRYTELLQKVYVM